MKVSICSTSLLSVRQKKKQNTYQILIGNIKTPRNIIFSHFDSIGNGAIDNASGTAIMIQVILSNKKSLKDNLFVFDGNEEISYDKPVYWGKGYRNFEKKYGKQISKAEKLIVIDCVGYDKLMNVYHSDLDIPELIKESYLEEALEILSNSVLI